MKAIQLNAYDNLDSVQLVEIDQPILHKGQVLVEVFNASLNPFDTTIRKGNMKDTLPLDLPVTLGGDISGIIVDTFEDDSGFKVGEKVYGQANVVAGNSGAFAERAATSAHQVAIMPANVSFVEAATLPLIGVSAIQALIEHLALQKNQKIFIHGGAGGIGSIAIRIAKHIGAYVATSASGEGIERVSQLGADEVIDYKTEQFSDCLHDFDAVFDTVGGADFEKSFAILKAGGHAVTMIAEFDQTSATRRNITALMQQTHVSTTALDTLRAYVEAGIIAADVGSVFSLTQAREAFVVRESGTTQGKVVLDVRSSP